MKLQKLHNNHFVTDNGRYEIMLRHNNRYALLDNESDVKVVEFDSLEEVSKYLEKLGEIKLIKQSAGRYITENEKYRIYLLENRKWALVDNSDNDHFANFKTLKELKKYLEQLGK